MGGAYDIAVFGIWQFFGWSNGKLGKFCSVFSEKNHAKETKISNFMKNIDGTTVICDKNDDITVILNLVHPLPIISHIP